MSNKRVKEALARYHLTQWRLAELSGCSECTMSRKMRHELPAEEQAKLIELIKAESAKR